MRLHAPKVGDFTRCTEGLTLVNSSIRTIFRVFPAAPPNITAMGLTPGVNVRRGGAAGVEHRRLAQEGAHYALSGY